MPQSHAPAFRFAISLTNHFAGMFARPGRMMLTVLGVVIGLTALVATLGLTRTAGNRIISQFDQVAATELFVSARPGITGMIDPNAIPWDAPARDSPPERRRGGRNHERGQCRRRACRVASPIEGPVESNRISSCRFTLRRLSYFAPCEPTLRRVVYPIQATRNVATVSPC